MVNNGNAAINSFTVNSNLQSGLQLISSTIHTVSGWTINEIAPGIYHFTGGTLLPGANNGVEFSQTIKAINCTQTAANYSVSYGCEQQLCDYPGKINAEKTATITIDPSQRPFVNVTHIAGLNNLIVKK